MKTNSSWAPEKVDVISDAWLVVGDDSELVETVVSYMEVMKTTTTVLRWLANRVESSDGKEELDVIIKKTM